MVRTVRTAAVVMHAPGKLQQKKEGGTHKRTIKTLSDSLFISWGKYTSAGKTVTLYRRNRDVRTNSPDPSSTREGHSENTVWGNPAKSSVDSARPSQPDQTRLTASSLFSRRTGCGEKPAPAVVPYTHLQLGKNSVSEDLAEVLGGNCLQSSLSLWLRSMK